MCFCALHKQTPEHGAQLGRQVDGAGARPNAGGPATGDPAAEGEGQTHLDDASSPRGQAARLARAPKVLGIGNTSTEIPKILFLLFFSRFYP